MRLTCCGRRITPGWFRSVAEPCTVPRLAILTSRSKLHAPPNGVVRGERYSQATFAPLAGRRCPSCLGAMEAASDR
jgi:hypothetical protein